MNDLQKIREKITPLNVLVVDDEDDLLDGIVSFMKKFCGCVDGAQNGEAALKLLQEKGPYDMVLTDVRMPKMTGWALAKELKNINQNIFVAVMTGSPLMNGIKHKDCDLFMLKPITIDKMQSMLELLITKQGL